MTQRTCAECPTDISGEHFNALLCPACRPARSPKLPSKPSFLAMSDGSRAYWAGLADGEGHLGIRPNSSTTTYFARFQLRMSDRWIIEAFAEQFGMSVDERTYSNALSTRPLHVTEVAGMYAATVVNSLLPYLRLKRRQAELMVMLETEKRIPGIRTRLTGAVPYTMKDGRVVTRKRYATGQDHLDRWTGYYEELRHLNKPSWNPKTPA